MALQGRNGKVPRRGPAGGQGELPDLVALYRCLNARHFRGALPDCRPRWNSRLRTTAGRVYPRQGVIELSPSYHLSFGLREVRDTLLHEMIHLDQHRRRIKVGHTKEMKARAKRLGIRRLSARDLPGRPRPRYRYRCPVCSRSVLRRIRTGRNRNACVHCCQRRNGGRWDRRFVLVLEEDLGRLAAGRPGARSAQNR